MDVIKKINSFTWQKWLERTPDPFFISLFADGISKAYFKKIGVPGVEYKAILVQDGFYWYESKEVWQEMAKELEIYLKKHSIFNITASLTDFYKKSRKGVMTIAKQKHGNYLKHLSEIYQILTTATTFIWLTHGLEEVYKKRLYKIVPKYIKGNINKFIGDASFPKKKNAHILMEEAMRRGDDPKIIARKFGWLSLRDAFSDPFSAKDIEKQMKGIKPPASYPKVKIPKELKPLFREVQELVYFRTARTDVFFELLFLSRPVLQRIGKLYNIPFARLKFYPIQSLITGEPRRYSDSVNFACYRGKAVFSEKRLIKEIRIKGSAKGLIRGRVAYQGVVKGTVKIVRSVSELSKVEKGDILVTPMTFPSFIVALKKAAAFVTNEGGITCHAAIISREMKKPCIIGTKIATQVLKDGDLVEVDADKGVVKILK